MITYYLHDGRNEAGPFNLADLQKQKLTRNTPIRQANSDKWMPAEKIDGLKAMVVPQKIRSAKDVVPVVAQQLSQLHYRKPRALYGTLLGTALLAGFSFYSINKASAKETPKPSAQLQVSAEQQAVLNQQRMAAEGAPVKEAKPLAVNKATEKENAAKASRLRWNKLISASNSNYGIGFLGGIKDLSVIVSNHSDYPLDEVVVNVTYIKASGGVWKTVPITLYAVQPHDNKDQPVPDAGRGKKVKVSLHKVVSKRMQFSYTEGKKGKDLGDPYFKEL